MPAPTVTPMNSAELYRLMTWLSPSYPVGSFCYSHGLEWLVETGAIADVESLVSWLSDILLLGSGRNDAILLSHAHGAVLHGNAAALWEVADYAGAIAAGAERYRESNAQGKAFTEITMATWGSPTLAEFCASYSRAVPFPVAVGAAAADHHIALEPALHAYVHAFTANLASAAVRLVPLGHTDGQRALMRLEASVAGAVTLGATGDLSLISNAAILADMASMQHETQNTRLFRS
jgi:urease accessory protein